MAPSKSDADEANAVLFYVPNLIGYSRLILNIACFFTFFNNHVLTFWMYLGSFTLDFFDGYFARKLNQCSILGIVLDMVTDRTGTAGFIMCLSHMYPTLPFGFGRGFWIVLFGILVTLDICSHWIQMYSSLSCGAQSHKDTAESKWLLLRLYYKGGGKGAITDKLFFGYCCIGAEVWYISLYMWASAVGLGHVGPIVFGSTGLYEFFFYLCCPGWAFKQVVNVVQAVGASQELAELTIQQNKAAKK